MQAFITSALLVDVGRLQCMACRSELFSLRPSCVFLNHGSYGAALRPARELQDWYRKLLELQPVQFMETIGLRALQVAVI